MQMNLKMHKVFWRNVMNNLTLHQALKLMFKINRNKDYESFFEGKGNGEVSFIVQSKIITMEV